MSKRFMIHLATLAAFAATGQAARAEWDARIDADGGSTYFLDRTRTRADGDRRQVWLKGDHSHDRSERSRSSMTLVSIDCRSMSTVTLSWTSYSPEGRPLASVEAADDGTGYQPIVPESVVDRVAATVCPA